MKDESRNAIRRVLGPSMYGMMLADNEGTTICSCCVEEDVKVLISDLRNGFKKSYRSISLVEVESGLYCDTCGEYQSEYYSEDEMFELEAQEAADSLYDSDTDLI
jgi:hypothetical protein